MAKRSDFTQKLLDDLRLRKERMGLAPSGQRPSASSSISASVASGDKKSRWSLRNSGEAVATNNASDKEGTKMRLGNRNKAPLVEGNSQQVVPLGRNTSRGHKIDLSMALALTLSNSGKLQNIEIQGNPSMGRKIVLHFDANMTPHAYKFPSLSPSQMGEVAKCVQNLNMMILTACSTGFNFNIDSIEIWRQLQDASDYILGGRHGKQQLKLLKAKDEDDESQSHRGNQRKPGSRSKFSFIRERRPDAQAVQQKQKAESDNEKSMRYTLANYNSNSSKSTTQLSSGSGFKSEAPSHNQVGFKENSVCNKVRLPNVIAKLMGLEELPASMEAKSTEHEQKSSEARARKEADQQTKGRIEHTTRAENIRKQQTRDKIEQIDSSVKIIDSDHEEKRTLSISDAKHNKAGNLVLKQQRDAFNQSHNERNSGKVQQYFVANKRVMKSKNIEKHPYELIKKSDDSNIKGLVNKNGSHNEKTNMRNKYSHSHHTRKESIKQSPEKGSSLKSDTRGENMGRTLTQETVMRRKSKQIQSAQKVNVLKIIQGDISSRSSVEAPTQSKSLQYRWKEIEKGSDAILELNLQQNVEIFNMEITNSNHISVEETKTATCSSPLTGEGNIQTSIDQPIQQVNVKSKKENSDCQIPERLCITMTACADKCFQEDSMEKYQKIQSGFKENKEKDHRRMIQLNGSKSIRCQKQTIMEVDQQVFLTKDENTLKQILITSQNFLNVAQALFQIKIPVDVLQATENTISDKAAKLFIDCGCELLRRKGKREESSIFTKGSLAPFKRSIDELIKEVNADLESFKYQNYTEGCGYDLADCLNMMIEKDIQKSHPDINCLWDFGWDRNTFACMEKDEITIDVEKHVLNGLLNELAKDLLNVSISIH